MMFLNENIELVKRFCKSNEIIMKIFTTGKTIHKRMLPFSIKSQRFGLKPKEYCTSKLQEV